MTLFGGWGWKDQAKKEKKGNHGHRQQCGDHGGGGLGGDGRRYGVINGGGEIQ